MVAVVEALREALREDSGVGGSGEGADAAGADEVGKGGAREAPEALQKSHPFEVAYDELDFQEMIGEGAFAEVWRGLWLQSPVAIKRLRKPVVVNGTGGGGGGGRGESGGESGGERERERERADRRALSVQELAARARATDARLMQYASRILSDDDAGRLSRRVTQTALREFMSDASTEKYVSFLNEVNVMNKLRHPNVMMYMGAVVDPSSPLCIVCELFRGGSLHDFLHSDPRFRPPRAEALRIALEVARGMNYLHSRSPPFLHRDLKPRNVLLSSATGAEPHVVICDFGMCKLFGEADEGSPGLVMGTASYMSPTVVGDIGEYTTADDVFSFAIVLWELVTGRVPFADMRPIQVVFGVAEDGLRPEITPEDALEPELVELIAQCWHEGAAERPCFADIIRRLDALLQRVLADQSSAEGARANGNDHVLPVRANEVSYPGPSPRPPLGRLRRSHTVAGGEEATRRFFSDSRW